MKKMFIFGTSHLLEHVLQLGRNPVFNDSDMLFLVIQYYMHPDNHHAVHMGTRDQLWEHIYQQTELYCRDHPGVEMEKVQSEIWNKIMQMAQILEPELRHFFSMNVVDMYDYTPAEVHEVAGDLYVVFYPVNEA
jgi:hypothetical protein